MADIVTLGFLPGTGLSIATLGFEPSAAAPEIPVVPSASDVVTLGFLPGSGLTVATIGFGQFSEVWPPASYNLGRFRRGDWVPAFFTLEGHPDAPPVLTIRDDAGNVVDSSSIPIASGLQFGMPVLVGIDYPLETLRMQVAYAVDGVPHAQYVDFDAVPGGDSGGSVISLFGYSFPRSRYILAQLASGTLVQGRNPRL
jgi:hypothetical protein